METKKAIILIIASVIIIIFLMILIVKVGPCKMEGFSFEDGGFCTPGDDGICELCMRLSNNGEELKACIARKREALDDQREASNMEIAKAKGVQYSSNPLIAHKDGTTLQLKGKLKHINRKLLEYTSAEQFLEDPKIKTLINEGCQIKERMSDEDGFFDNTDQVTILQSCLDKYGKNVEIAEMRSQLFAHIVDILLICKEHVENYTHLTSMSRRWIQKFAEFANMSYEDVHKFWKKQNDRLG
tara:strand:- start:13 stop:738 length:726 start_codon:yes stop_codon:yes gene_type:complete